MTASHATDEWHALDAPFTPRPDWQPVPGRCSRCGQRAWLGEKRWWHDGDVCRPDWRTADFLPDPRGA